MTSLQDEVRLSAVVANFNGMGTLAGTLESLQKYPIPIAEIIVVDDGSTDGSTEWLRSQHPDVCLVAFARNTGNLARVRNAGIEASTGTHIFLADNDIEILPGCLHRLLDVIRADERVFCVTPRLVYYDRPEVLFQDGNGVHFLALGTATRRGTPVAEAGVPAPFPTCGGGIMLLDRSRLRRVGDFDPGYLHAWADDAELQLRGVLYGMRCLHVPAASARHHAKVHGAKRARGQIYNRFRVLLTFYRKRTLLVLLPSLLVFELGLIATSVTHGFFGAYVAASRQAWRERRSILAVRRELQRRREVPDSQLFLAGPFELPGMFAPGPGARRAIALLQRVFDANWRIARWVQ